LKNHSAGFAMISGVSGFQSWQYRRSWQFWQSLRVDFCFSFSPHAIMNP